MIFLHILFCIELFYSLFLVHIFLPVNVLLLNFLPVDLLLLESRRFLPMIFFIWFCLLVLSSHFLPANVLLVGFLLVENHHFWHYMWFFYFWILYLWICTWVCCVCILFFTSDFFAPILVLRGGKKFAVPRSLIGILRSIASFSGLHCTCISHLPGKSPKFTFKVIY